MYNIQTTTKRKATIYRKERPLGHWLLKRRKEEPKSIKSYTIDSPTHQTDNHALWFPFLSSLAHHMSGSKDHVTCVSRDADSARCHQLGVRLPLHQPPLFLPPSISCPLVFVGLGGRNHYFVAIVIPEEQLGDYNEILSAPGDPYKYRWTRYKGRWGWGDLTVFFLVPEVRNLSFLLRVKLKLFNE